MAQRVSNQVAHACKNSLSLTNTAPSNANPVGVLHGVVGDDNMASLTVDAAIEVTCYYYHHQSKIWRQAGYGAATSKVTFEQYGTYGWTVPKGSWVYFLASVAGPTAAWTDLQPLG